MPTIRWTRSRRGTPRRALPVGPPTRSDEELLCDVAAGDHSAFVALSARFAGLVYANTWRALRDEACTDAVAADVFVEVWRQAAGFDPARSSALIWILDLAHRLAAEQARAVAGAAAEPVGVTPP